MNNPSIQSNAPKTVSREHPCRHCGTPCPGGTGELPDPEFCCQGCRTVYELLHSNGLNHYYEIDEQSTIPIPIASRHTDFTYLDDPTLSNQLLDSSRNGIAKIRFHIPAIHCAACVWLLEHLFQLDDRIGESSVNLLTKELRVSFSIQELPLSGLVQRLHSLGYPPRINLDAANSTEGTPQRATFTLKLGITGFCFGNIMLLSFPHYLGYQGANDSFATSLKLLPLLLSLPVLVIGMIDYGKPALANLRNKFVSIEVPIALGIMALFMESMRQTFALNEVGYWDSLAGLIFFLLCGRAFKERALDHLSYEQDYQAFFPLSVQRINQGTIEVVALSELEKGDIIAVRNQELVPADCTLLSSRASMDYSFVSGEADPATIEQQETVQAGGKNLGSTIELRVEHPVATSYLTSLWSHQAFQSPRGREFKNITDRVSQYFTLTVITIAVAAALVWGWIAPSESAGVLAAILIVACPCALALAAPFATGTALRILRHRGIYPKDSGVIERLAQTTAILFDKTGTLTIAEPRTTQHHGPALSESESRLVVSVAQHSTHPYSVSLLQSLPVSSLECGVSSYHQVPGKGVMATIANHQVLYGQATWLEAQGIPLPSPLNNQNAVHLAIDDTYRGCFTSNIRYRQGVPEAVAQLAKQYPLHLASGDNDRDQNTLRAIFGKNAAFAFQQTPYDKLAMVERLQQNNEVVLFLGDGLNDAGALKQADVGMAVTDNSSHFSPANDAILDGNQIAYLPAILKFARATVRVVIACFILSFLYNLIGISLAATGQLSPLIAAILMPLSSVSIVALATALTTQRAKHFGLLSPSVTREAAE